MRKTYFHVKVMLSALLLCMAMMQASADPITREQAKQRVMAFQKKQGDTHEIKAVVSEKRLAPRKGAAAQTATEPYYLTRKIRIYLQIVVITNLRVRSPRCEALKIAVAGYILGLAACRYTVSNKLNT